MISLWRLFGLLLFGFSGLAVGLGKKSNGRIFVLVMLCNQKEGCNRNFFYRKAPRLLEYSLDSASLVQTQMKKYRPALIKTYEVPRSKISSLKALLHPL